jgi:hypothetical protein
MIPPISEAKKKKVAKSMKMRPKTPLQFQGTFTRKELEKMNATVKYCT